jgi:hypothetical protein
VIMIIHVWGSHGIVGGDYCLLGCDTTQSCRWLPTFLRNIISHPRRPQLIWLLFVMIVCVIGM